jgi:hypothetical protein
MHDMMNSSQDKLHWDFVYAIASNVHLFEYIQLIAAFPEVLPKSRKECFPGTYPQSDDESDEDNSKKTEGNTMQITLKLGCQTTGTRKTKTKGRQTSKSSTIVKNGKRRKGHKENRNIKRSYKQSRPTEVYYL